jgi:hypothetical protein
MRFLPVCILAVAIGSTLTAERIAAAPDQTQGVALLSAVVSSSGNLAHGAGAVSAAPLQTGVTKVTFNRPVGACNLVASVLTPVLSPAPAGFAGFITVSPVINVPDTIVVTTRSVASGAPLQNQAFSLIVFCER